MLSRLKALLVRLYLDLLGKPTVSVLSILARSQLSANPFARAAGYLPFQFVDRVLAMDALLLISHVSQRRPERKRRSRIRNLRLRSYIYLGVGRPEKGMAAMPTREAFRAALLDENLDVNSQYALGHQLFQAGNLALACEAFEDLVQRRLDKQLLERRLQVLRDTGIAFFMLGKIEMANRYWRMRGELRRLILGGESGPIYRILGDSWFAAIGHVAMLAMYIKYNRLYRGEDVRVVAQWDLSAAPGSYLCERLAKEGLEFIPMGALQPDYDRWAKRHGKRRWDQLSAAERSTHIDDFWEFEFPDGQVLGYTHAAARVEQEWERQQRPALLSVTGEESDFIDRTLGLLGLPKDAWYVCLHVREQGFHKSWNTLYPSMRDANIDDYLPAIDLIVKRGGWVIRLGDPFMKPLPPLPNVIDYAHSPLKTPRADILIPLRCRFFLGTNSGLATVPSIYGVRCVLSNWVPIGLPLWSSRDLVMPKLFFTEEQERYLALEEVFASGLAFIQNWSDLPKGIRLRDNTPEEIRDLTAEALGVTPEWSGGGLDEARAVYREIASRYESYTGSTLAASFIRRHRPLLVPREGSAAGAQRDLSGELVKRDGAEGTPAGVAPKAFLEDRN